MLKPKRIALGRDWLAIGYGSEETLVQFERSQLYLSSQTGQAGGWGALQRLEIPKTEIAEALGLEPMDLFILHEVVALAIDPADEYLAVTSRVSTGGAGSAGNTQNVVSVFKPNSAMDGWELVTIVRLTNEEVAQEEAQQTFGASLAILDGKMAVGTTVQNPVGSSTAMFELYALSSNEIVRERRCAGELEEQITRLGETVALSGTESDMSLFSLGYGVDDQKWAVFSCPPSEPISPNRRDAEVSYQDFGIGSDTSIALAGSASYLLARLGSQEKASLFRFESNQDFPRPADFYLPSTPGRALVALSQSGTTSSPQVLLGHQNRALYTARDNVMQQGDVPRAYTSYSSLDENAELLAAQINDEGELVLIANDALHFATTTP